MRVGPRSRIFLVYAYHLGERALGPFDLDAFERRLLPAHFRKKAFDIEGVMPHLGTQLETGELMRVFRPGEKLGNWFSSKSIWRLTDERGKRSVEVQIPSGPTLYVLETGFTFVALELRPRVETLPELQDALYALVRGDAARLDEADMPEKAVGWSELKRERGVPGAALRDWLAALVPGLPPEVPLGARDRPAAVSILYVESAVDPAVAHRLRLVYRSAAEFEPSPADADLDRHAAAWRASKRELVLFSPLGVTWLVHPIDPDGHLASLGDTLLARYVYKWVLVEHQKLILLSLSTRCAILAKRHTKAAFASLRRDLLRYIAIYQFSHVSYEPRHEEFYGTLRRVLDIDGLVAEVKEEITETDDYLSDLRAEILNRVLAMLTFVLTPAGLLIGIFERDTLPAGELSSVRFWSALPTHGPTWLVVVAAVIGAFAYVRVMRTGGLLRPPAEARELEEAQPAVPASRRGGPSSRRDPRPR